MNDLNRNSPCSCGSKKKYKNCCGKGKLNKNWYSSFINILLPLLIIICIGVVTSKVLMSDKDLEQVWCDNCQTYHSKAVAKDEKESEEKN